MKLPPTSQQKTSAASVRTAFTLVELLVVIAIIVVLVSLLMVGVFKALDSAYQAQTRTDITQLAAAVQSFETAKQLNYIPSRIRLREILVYDINNLNPAIAQYEKDSAEYLQKVWPRLSGIQIAVGGTMVPWVDWNGDGVPDSQPGVPPNFSGNLQDPSLYVDLEGEQCLVFFLGGIPQYVAATNTFTTTGFSTNATNPSQPTGDRVPPYFEFRSNRLIQLPGTAPLFPSYVDGYGKTPYAYFSSYKTANGYNRYLVFGSSDCQTLGVWPYAQSWGSSPVYHNSQTFQIISAGKDFTFGPGSSPTLLTTWTPSTAAQVYVQGVPGGYDDIANFYDRLLGVPTQ